MPPESENNPSLENEGDTSKLPPGVAVVHSVSLRPMPAAPNAPPESLLGERTRYARNDLKLKIEALSRLTKEYDSQGNGLSPTSIARYESGESLPGIREFRILCEALDVPMAWLLYGDATDPEERTKLTMGERQLIVGMRTMMAEQRDDSAIASADGTADYLQAQVRMNRLAKARKPLTE